MRKIILFLFVVFLVGNVSASCEKSQININTASVEELDKLTGIGPVKAEEIIKSRPFESVDDLIKVYGIGEITLSKIKEQGLACVENEEKENLGEPAESGPLQTITTNVIKLSPQNIKSDNDKKDTDKSWAIYGFVGFCALLGFLFGIKYLRGRRYKKNEFEE